MNANLMSLRSKLCAALILIAVLLLFFQSTASAQTKAERYKAVARKELGITPSQFPSAERVISSVAGQGLEADAKRAVALIELQFAIHWLYAAPG